MPAPPTQYADLEITFSKRDAQTYGLHFRYDSPTDSEVRTSETDPLIAADWSKLIGLDEDPNYGSILTGILFTKDTTSEFMKFRNFASAQNLALRVQLVFDSSSPELHTLHWETLRDPGSSDPTTPLFMGENVLLSRFLNADGINWRPVRSQAKARLAALVVISNAPARTQLSRIDVPAAVAQVDVSLLVSSDDASAEGRPTLQNLVAKLREGFDILYLVCHGQLAVPDPLQYPNWKVDGTERLEPHLYLDGADTAIPTLGQDFVQAIEGLDRRPRLIVLASCQSAGQGDSGLAGLGPRLAKVGTPAVIAMQGNVYMKTADTFMKIFFRELARDGRIDRAVSVARGDVSIDRTDYWRPVLFLRLKTGCMWYEPGFNGGDDDDETRWKGIERAVIKKNFVPLLGPELGEELFRGTQEWAQNLAKVNRFPLGPHASRDLAKVAQFIDVNRKQDGVAFEAVKIESTRLIRRWVKPEEFAKYPDGVVLSSLQEEELLDEREQLLAMAVEKCRADPNNPYRILSGLAASIFVNASYETLLNEVIAATAKKPQKIAVPWLGSGVTQAPRPATPPTPDTPWVYQIYGDFDDEDSRVVTEDNFFDYLITATRDNLLDQVIPKLLDNKSLLFLGFRLDDWRFRVLFRLILSYEGAKLIQSDLPHVGVQVNPEEQSVSDVRRTIQYMERYFSSKNSPEISIYWGSATDFLKQLRDKTTRSPSAV